jgi:hypothetical protein
MKQKRRATIELALAVVLAACAVWAWFGAQSVVTVSPILPGEPQTTSVAYSPPMLVLALLLATAAGVLAVLGLAGLRRVRKPAPAKLGAPPAYGGRSRS